MGVTQDAAGAASGVAITSVRQPLVDDLTVRQTGAIAYALSGLVNARIEAQQQKVFEELKLRSRVYLDKLERLDLERPDPPRACRTSPEPRPGPVPVLQRKAHLASVAFVRGPLPLFGPAFVAAIAYIDPGNFATNITAGRASATSWSGS